MKEPVKSEYTDSDLDTIELREKISAIESDIKKFKTKRYLAFAIFPSVLFWFSIIILDWIYYSIAASWESIWIVAVPSIIIYIFVAFLDEEFNFKIFNNSRTKSLAFELEALRKTYNEVLKFEAAHSTWSYYNSVNKEGYWLTKKGVNLENDFGYLLQKKGYNVQRTKSTGDGGVDLICQIHGKEIYVQCKGYAKKLGVAAIRDAAGVKATRKPLMMLVVCPVGFTKGSYEFAQSSGVILLAVKDIIDIAEDRTDILKFKS